ncbi:MAG TPA: helix-turn-helix transcriptional regulator [Mycobacteriales bacterium]|nr:helix-turn-helix transcriptional regulator [Mycobacteriales bacterium]
MPTYRMSEAASLLGVSDDTVRRWADDGRVETATLANGRQGVDGASLARLLVELGQSSGPATSTVSSARNHFTGLVTAVTRDTVMAQVELQAGPFRIVSLLSREAADQLGLEPGVLATASVKATNVTIEIPDGA